MTYRDITQIIVEQENAVLPEGYDSWAIKAVHPDLVSSRGFKWPFPGGETPYLKLDDHDNSCPSRKGDGLCVATTIGASSSGGHLFSTVLLVAYRSSEARGAISDKLRVPQAAVVALVDGARLLRDDASYLDMRYARLTDMNLTRIVATWSDFSSAYMQNADLTGSDFAHSNLSHAYMTGASLANSYLSHANLLGAHLDDADLSHANLYCTNLETATLSYANLSYANLSYAYLFEADLHDADLHDADLSNSHLSNVNLRNANLTRANLSNAYLVNADLHGANLEGAILPPNYQDQIL